MMRDNTRFCALNLPVLVPPRVPIPESPVHKRLRQGFARLENIQLVRNHRQDTRFEKAVEERIIWRELLDLELQDIDDHIERASFAAGRSRMKILLAADFSTASQAALEEVASRPWPAASAFEVVSVVEPSHLWATSEIAQEAAQRSEKLITQAVEFLRSKGRIQPVLRCLEILRQPS